MIKRNIGNFERLLRLFLGVLFTLWALTQPYLAGIEYFVLSISTMLILNSLFSRCYIWYVLGLHSCDLDPLVTH